jgi:hypothetical protein
LVLPLQSPWLAECWSRLRATIETGTPTVRKSGREREREQQRLGMGEMVVDHTKKRFHRTERVGKSDVLESFGRRYFLTRIHVDE